MKASISGKAGQVWAGLFTGIVLLLVGGLILVPAVHSSLFPIQYVRSDTAHLEVDHPSIQNGEIDLQTLSLVRGQPVRLLARGRTSSLVTDGRHRFSIDNTHLSPTLELAIALETVHPRRLISLRKEPGGPLSKQTVNVDDKLRVLSIQPGTLNPQTGELGWIEVEFQGSSWFVPGTAVSAVPVSEESLYDLEGYTQPDFADNPRPESRRGIHVTLENLILHEDALLTYLRESGMNCLVIALKGVDGKVWYESEAPDRYYQSAFAMNRNALISQADLAELVERLHEQGIYAIARLETFQDASLALDSPDLAITNTAGQPAVLGGSCWLSPYLRRNWMYALDLAREAAQAGFNEVQFDFCRFPESMDASGLDVKNEYGETPAQAIANFLYYAREELEPLHVYTACDLFAGPVSENSDYSIGQYYPALIAASNVVCPMAYLQTLQSLPENRGIEVFTQARDVMRRFASTALIKADAQPNTADVCLWLQGFGLMSPETLRAQIEGMHQGGSDSWLVWCDEGDLDRLLPLQKAFERTSSACSAAAPS